MSNEIKETINYNEEETPSNQQSDITVKYLTFLSDGLLFGVNASYVTEIITNHHITVLPMIPDFIKGIINLRGQIIPIIDIRLRMGKMEAEYNDMSCIIVLNINSILIGIFVDTVSQVVDLDESKISPPTANNKQELVNGIISLANGKVLLLLDCELLVMN